MDIKSLIEKTGINAKELRFLKAPSYPYIVFTDDILVNGSDDMRKIIIEHTTAIELYTKSINQDEASTKIEEFILNDLNVGFSRRREWIDEESHFLTTYSFTFLEKKGRR